MKTKIKFLKLNLQEVSFIFFLLMPFFIYLAEVFTYQGFIEKYFIFSSIYFVCFSVFIVTLYVSTDVKTNKRCIRLFSNIFSVTLPIFFLSLFLLGYLEEANYPNYVFSKFHIDFLNIPLLISYNFYLLLIILLKQEMDFKKLKIKSVTSRIILGTTFFLLSLYLINNISSVLSLVKRNVSYSLSNTKATYDEKMIEKMGFFYEYMQFIKAHTPEDAVIHKPPKLDPWHMTGNAGLVRYFLYPRKLVSTGDQYILSESDYDYMMISKGFFNQAGDWGHGWPKVPVEAEKILYIDPDTKEIVEVSGDYDPRDAVERGEWGLIKIRVNE